MLPLLLAMIAAVVHAADAPHVVLVLDDQTGRGVPLVELKTVSNVSFFTDSAGVAAINDPAMLGHKTFLSVESPGYEFPADGFGFHSKSIDLKPGEQTTLKIHRINIAERLYRLTGQGIYRDSVMAGRPTPIREPMLNAQVVGQDSCQAAVFSGKIHWFFGDTLRLSYPLGHYHTAGATSSLPGSGGLDPALGVDLTYFTNTEGFSRGTIEGVGAHPIWLDGLVAFTDESGASHLVGEAGTMQSLAVCLSRALVEWDGDRNQFKKVSDIPLDSPLYLRGHPFIFSDNGKSYIYAGDCLPDIRVPADLASVRDLSRYEGFTCLTAGARFDGSRTQLDRDAKGQLIWGWKKDTAVLNDKQLGRLIKDGKMKSEEIYFRPIDVVTKKPIRLVAGSVCYNAYRKKWIMIACQLGGDSSELGEIWYSEADRPEGPWAWAKKIVTHNRYSFYNPVQHPYFDQDGGRLIYFEGTYATTFSGNDHPTPYYDYNQMMYRLDLSDPRLKLP